MRIPRRYYWVPVLAGLFLAANPAGVAAAEVKDDAGFFSPDAVRKANQQLEEIKRRYDRSLVIETFKTVPEGKADKLAGAQDRRRVYDEWAKERARARDADIYALITREPSHVEVVARTRLQKQFSDQERGRLADLLVKHFDTKHYDQGLSEAVRFVQTALADSTAPAKSQARENAGAAADRQHGSNWSWVIWLLLIGLGAFLLIGLFRAMSGGFGGGGFLTSLLGGLFGAAAGMWLYNTFFGGSTHASDAGTTGEDAGTGGDDDYSGSGGDFGGGDDYGGSGGDFGGGDFGGGGDF
jgi:uncharacterized protein